MINKRIFFTLATAATISGFLVVCTLGQTMHRNKVEAKESRILEELSSNEIIVREYNGKIGIYNGDSPKPYRVIDFSVKLLSDYDRSRLAEGIVLKSEDELNRFTEDMFS